MLGRLNPRYFLGGELALDPERARGAVETLREPLGLGLEETAQAIIELAVENMVGAIRLLCADRGIDYRSLDLIAFGGAGPLHASPDSERLGLGRLVVPPHPGLASALGALAADLRVDMRVTRSFRSDEPDGAPRLRESLELLADDALAALREEGDPQAPIVVLNAACRYVGQNYEHEVSLTLDDREDLLELTASRFHALHEATYGYRLPDAVVEIVHHGASAIDTARAPLVARSPRGGESRPQRVDRCSSRGMLG